METSLYPIRRDQENLGKVAMRDSIHEVFDFISSTLYLDGICANCAKAGDWKARVAGNETTLVFAKDVCPICFKEVKN